MSAAKQRDRNLELVQAMGAGSYDPIPPDQYLAEFDPRESGVIQTVAWVRSKTIRHGHHSTFAVDDEGNELHLADLARDRGVDLRNARHDWLEAEARGYIRREGKKLCLCGRVKNARISMAKKKGNVVCTNHFFPADIRRAREAMKTEARAAFDLDWKRKDAFEKVAIADGVRHIRVGAIEPLEDNILRHHGLPPIKRLAKRKPAEGCVRVDVLAVPEPLAHFVQTTFALEEERTDHRTVVSTEAESGSVPSAASLLLLKQAATLTPTTPLGDASHSPSSSSSSLPPAPDDDDREPVTEALKAAIGVQTPKAVSLLVDACRKVAPDVTAIEVAYAVAKKAKLAQRPSVNNRMGFLLRAVPELLEGDGLRVIREEIRSGPPPHAPGDYWEDRYRRMIAARKAASNG